ncbi:acylphosphatase [Candidatus Beckwithbacteria bacterium]|nr:acylphosphatase [Candidatus Beckwithbacteria bacterium]
MKKHLNITITGRVQGVGFRFFVKSLATKFNLSGFVKNQINGSVYLEIEGDTPNIEEFLVKIKQGPRNAKVQDFKIEEVKIKNFASFEILR